MWEKGSVEMRPHSFLYRLMIAGCYAVLAMSLSLPAVAAQDKIPEKMIAQQITEPAPALEPMVIQPVSCPDPLPASPAAGFTFASFLIAWAPFIGLLMVAFVMHYRLKRMELLQQEEFEKAHRKETMLLVRERSVLVSTLEGELSENKNRIEAFLTIYRDMLQDMKNPADMPLYQKAGDIVQKHPSLSKTVFEANVSKLSLLDMKLAGKIAKLYTALPKEQEYINIDANVPIDTAIKLIEKILKEAEEMLPPVHQAITALDEIIAKKEG